MGRGGGWSVGKGKWEQYIQTHDFANSTTLWFSGSQMLLSLPVPSPEATRAELTL